MINRNKILELIKAHYPELEIKLHHIKIQKEGKVKIDHRELNKLIPKSIFSDFIKEKHFPKTSNGSVYHYLPVKFLNNITNGKLRLYNLNKYLISGQDEEEYSAFINLINLLLPRGEEQLSEIKENIYILSCTDKEDSLKHWNSFGKETPACIKFNYKKKSNHLISDIRKVVYENELYKFFCLLECFKEQFNLFLEIEGWDTFSKHFKRSYFNWESEVRISFDKSRYTIKKVMLSAMGNNSPLVEESYFEVQTDNKGYNFIEVDINNDGFELQIEHIQLKERNEGIENLCQQKNIKVIY